jgi:hypothetical protein
VNSTLYSLLHNLLNVRVLVQTANKMGFKKKNPGLFVYKLI